MPSTASPAPRPRRADAERSRAAVLDAATALLAERPDAGMGDIAAAAGVTRQTVYAHFASRDALVGAVTERVTGEAVAAMDEAGLEEGPAAEALTRLQDIGWRLFRRNPVVIQAGTDPVRGGSGETLHEPVDARLTRLVERGQRDGEFDPAPPAAWLVAVVTALGHAAGHEVAAGRMSADEGADALRTATLRALGAPPCVPGDTPSPP
ncbi:TetR family transcriptional regulator [Streptomyces sp. SID4919]|uniref:TetR/AcrR family transcriptional regulator n=1 Tax=unclassified Streptomyces TaxID=2593676 RepID=UPI0008237C7E|nr:MULTISPECIES: TetR/AcrR family transcriptional regulator [unclassified Streptomyces]MYY11229.1 TetR family transcriptional regulator [Streptomyces sp. SID4919]SCK16682.1 transcriptional regulator, TetR family [Streptomyces sp. AmelKG-E11A]